MAPAEYSPNAPAPATAVAPESRNSPAVKASFYRPELDCLRFFAILGVFIHHSIPKTADFYQAHHLPVVLLNIPQAGAFGVDLFYCLSAYLITELLLREKDMIGHLNVKAFYIRRVLRIWPLYFSFVLFTYGLTFVDPSQHFSTVHFIMFLFLAGNWAAATGRVESVVVPLWSVSFEEQFYLLWPLVVWKASRKQMMQVCASMIAIAYLWRGVLTARMQDPHGLIWNGTFGHLDTLSYGIILSLLGLPTEIPAWRRLALLFLGSGAYLLAAAVRDHGDWMMALAALGSVAILRAGVGLKLKHPVLVRLGVVSYGLYVYHELFLAYLKLLFPNTHRSLFVVWFILSLVSTSVAALLSYRWLESPFLRLKERFTIVKSRPA